MESNSYSIRQERNLLPGYLPNPRPGNVDQVILMTLPKAGAGLGEPKPAWIFSRHYRQATSAKQSF